MKKDKLKDEDILSILTSELSNSNIFQDLEAPLDYYLGNPNGKEVEGRSQLMSLDVADSIEWIMPQVMKSFTQSNEVVTFDATSEVDEQQAELESEYVYDILMKRNPGFVLLHQLVKDALLQRNGIFKVYYENEEEEVTEEYTGLREEEIIVLLSDPQVEVTSVSLADPILQTTDISIVRTTKKHCIKIDSVPPENFRVNSDHNSIFVDNCRFSAHVMQKTASDLIKDGFDKKVIDELPGNSTNLSNYRFQQQGEMIFEDSESNIDRSTRRIQVYECYTYMDINNDGIAEYVKVTAAGSGEENPTHILDIEELIECPWITAAAILMSHKFQGLSIYDRLKELQDNKTALIRNIMDNMYLQNNQRYKVLEGQVNISDLMLSTVGGNVRVKRMDALEPIVTPGLSNTAFDLMNYLDQVRAGRSGVSAEGASAPQNLNERVGSEGVARLMSSKEELVGLIVRVLCETGVKPLCVKIRDLARKHFDVIEDFKFRGSWVKVNPKLWRNRVSSTVKVGTGSGDLTAKLMAVTQVLNYQNTVLNSPYAGFVKMQNVYAALNDFCKLSNLNGASKYFVDPDSEEGVQIGQNISVQQQQQQQKMEEQQKAMIQMELQLANAETKKAEAQQASVMLKSQVETEKQRIDFMKAQFEAELAAAQSQADQYKLALEMNNEAAKVYLAHAQVEVDHKKIAADLIKNEEDNKTKLIIAEVQHEAKVIELVNNNEMKRVDIAAKKELTKTELEHAKTAQQRDHSHNKNMQAKEFEDKRTLANEVKTESEKLLEKHRSLMPNRGKKND